MPRFLELRRHTDNDGDVLSPEGVTAAVTLGATLSGNYEAVWTSGAQRAAQTPACLLAGLGWVGTARVSLSKPACVRTMETNGARHIRLRAPVTSSL